MPLRTDHNHNMIAQDVMSPSAVVRMQPVLALLRESDELANRLMIDRWQLAVNISQLRFAGATSADLRQLIATGLGQHQTELAPVEDSPRAFRQSTIEFDESSCFVLSKDGLRLINREIGNVTREGSSKIKPTWDPTRNELRIAGQLVKRFKWRAPNQQHLIEAFQKMNWAEKIDDPFPCPTTVDTKPIEADPFDVDWVDVDSIDTDSIEAKPVDAKRRLHDTIKCLNRRHANNLIRFHGDGTGRCAIWRISAGRPGTKSSPGPHVNLQSATSSQPRLQFDSLDSP